MNGEDDDIALGPPRQGPRRSPQAIPAYATVGVCSAANAELPV